VKLISKGELAGLREQAADAERARAAATEAGRAREEAERQAAKTRDDAGGWVRDAETRMASLARELAASTETADRLRAELAAALDRRAEDTAAAMTALVLEARDYALGVAAMTGDGVSVSMYGLNKAAEQARIVQQTAAALEEFLAEGFGDLAELRIRMAALRRAADGQDRGDLTDVLTRAQFIYLYLAGRPAEITLQSWENAWYSNTAKKPASAPWDNLD
jgi:hypothetical protein